MNQLIGKPADIGRIKEARRRRNTLILGFMLIGGGILVLVGIILYQAANAPVRTLSRIQIGAPLRDFALNDLSGKTVHLSDYAGRTVLINGWATWCPPCKTEMPALNQYYLAHRDQGFVLLAVDAGDPQDTTAEFASKNGLSFPVLLDPGARVLDTMGINDFPTSILVGRDGTVKTVHFGAYTLEALEADINPLLQ